MRTRNAIYNNISSAVLQFTILFFGLIIPRIMISTYGSEINGLVSSTKQMVSYLKFLELGITAALVYSLYEPLAKNDYELVNPLITRAKKEYEKISLGYFVGLVLLSLVYPLILKEELGYTFLVLVVFFVGLYGAFDFYTISKYRVLLDGDQKTYILNIITTITTIIQNIASLVLLKTNQSVLLVVFIPIIFFPIRSLFLNYYVKRKYKFIDYNSKPSNLKIESRKDAFISGLSDSLNLTLPIVFVSFLISLEMASVFSVYSMVFLGLSSIVGVFNSGLRSVFGNVYAKGEIETFKRSNNYFEFMLYGLLAVLYSTALATIIPFVKIYVTNSDVKYDYPIIGILFTLWSVLHNTRVPNQTVIDATGKWKLSTRVNLIQTFLLIISVILFGYLFGINGILIGMIISSSYKTIMLMNISNKKIMNIKNIISFRRFFRIFAIIAIVNVPLFIGFVKFEVTNFIGWFIQTLLWFVWSLIITVLINLIFDKDTFTKVFRRFILKNKHKNK